MNDSAPRRFSRRGAVALAAAGTLTAAAAAPAVAARRTAPNSRALNSRQQAGQRVIFSYPGLTPPDDLLAHIRAGECAGVIFFGENVSDAAQLAGVATQLQAAAAASPVNAPLLLMTDQEGGRVNRVPGGPDSSAKQVGADSDPAGTASATGRAAAQALRGAGLNLNLAPVLGVYRSEGDFLDGSERSYGMDPGVVGTAATAFLTAQQNAGIAATAKHFPGLGSASAEQNTDEGPVTLDVALSELRSVDESPYPKAIGAGVKLVMPSWAIYPALDANNPAGLSAKVLGDELRGRLGFTGVTVSDALEAGALQAFGDTGQRTIRAADAGIDLILASARDVDQGAAAVTALAAALDGGKLPSDAFGAALGRVSGLRDGLR